MAEDLQKQLEDRGVTPPAVISGLPDRDDPMAQLPTEDELGVEDDKPVESTEHREQGNLMMHLLERALSHREDICIAGDLGVFYRLQHPPVVPDVMVVLGVKKRQRKAYLVWDEGKGPSWVLELLSASNVAKDRETNYDIYEQHLRVPEYVWFNPDDPNELRGFRLVGDHYQEIAPDEQGRLWSQVLEHALGVHDGWLRLYDRDGNLVPTGDELAAQAQERAAQAQERATRERAIREAAEAELARLREELERLKAGRSPDLQT